MPGIFHLAYYALVIGKQTTWQMRYWSFLLSFILCFCNKGQKGKEVSLFIMPEYKDDFTIRINDSETIFSYKPKIEMHGPQELIEKANLFCGLLEIELRIMNKDTSFCYDISTTDSLFFGLTIENDAFVIQNENEYIDYYD